MGYSRTGTTFYQARSIGLHPTSISLFLFPLWPAVRCHSIRHPLAAATDQDMEHFCNIWPIQRKIGYWITILGEKDQYVVEHPCGNIGSGVSSTKAR